MEFLVAVAAIAVAARQAVRLSVVFAGGELESWAAVACGGCAKGYGFLGHLPIVGFFYRRRGCRGCGRVLPMGAVAVEVAAVVIATAAMLVFGVGMLGGFAVVLLVVLLALAVADLVTLSIPVFVPVGQTLILFAAAWITEGSLLAGWRLAVAVGMGLFVWGFGAAFGAVIGRHVLGDGDAWIAAMLTMMVGVDGVVSVVLFGATLALAVILIGCLGRDYRVAAAVAMAVGLGGAWWMDAVAVAQLSLLGLLGLLSLVRGAEVREAAAVPFVPMLAVAAMLVVLAPERSASMAIPLPTVVKRFDPGPFFNS